MFETIVDRELVNRIVNQAHLRKISDDSIEQILGDEKATSSNVQY